VILAGVRGAQRAPLNEPFVLNADSPQAANLYRWWPALAARGGVGIGMSVPELVAGSRAVTPASNNTPRYSTGFSSTNESTTPCPHGGFIEPNTWGFQTAANEPYLPFPVTLAVWVCPHDLTLARNFFWHRDGSNTGYRIGNTGAGVLHFTIGGVAAYTFSGLASLVADVWQLWAVSIPGNSTTATGYVYRADTNTLSKGTASIGSMTGTPTYWAVGGGSSTLHGMRWSDARVYRGPKTDAEILHMAEPTTRFDLYGVRSRTYFIPAAAPPGGTTIPIFHRHYANMRAA